jgi:NAD(P)-dependent dehydrogenase (short-subunit alcohol dehydrogenase family)
MSRTIGAMEIAGTYCVVTGGASGIGRALARRLAAEGAAGVAVVDRDLPGAEAVAAELAGARAYACDVGDPNQIATVIDAIEADMGPIALFCANAGIAIGTDLETTDDDWDLAFAVNTKSHYYAARRLVPRWIERGGGYFVSTASAAGLLTQIGSAPYAVTKHAAVAFSEWLAITYGDQGVKVSCLCPQGVNTNMLRGTASIESTGASVVRASGEVLEPEAVAEAVVATIFAERFLVLPHPEVLEYWRRKTSDYDRWIAGMRRLQAKVRAS